ncbi:hypothetical protein S40288_01458 [Stachybotrys chartarum IBT 40288]|nr:hypothetical protein S40288_01458 [Stachybotrys chartarum IBT 40288]
MPRLETYNGYPLWLYVPNIGAAIAFTVLFAIMTTMHTYMMVKHRMWFCLPFVVGGLFETVGYIGRALAHSSTGTLGPYIMQSTLLLLAPVLFAASLYMTLKRIVGATRGEKYSPVRPRWLTRVFVMGDCFSFLLQASGAGLLVQGADGDGDGSSAQTGENIILGGLIFQIGIFAAYLAVAGIFHRRLSRREDAELSADVRWRGILYMLYGTSLFVMARNVFRAIEYGMGHDGYLLANEWPVYVFDGALMLLTMGAFLVRYPSGLVRVKA